MKTLNKRVKEALENYKFNNNEPADINAIIAYAYYLGRCEAAKEVCEDAKKIFAEQKKRAAECRYHKMAMDVQGNNDYIYHQDYDAWIHDFSEDETEI